MPVKMIGDILTAQLPHMQPYIRFCSCQLNGAALIQQKTDEVPEFKEFVKVGTLYLSPVITHLSPICSVLRTSRDINTPFTLTSWVGP